MNRILTIPSNPLACGNTSRRDRSYFHISRFAYILLAFVCLAPQIGWGRPQDEDPKRSLLGERQRLVERKMAELESKFTTIAQQLAEKEPERAERLIKAYQMAKETLLTEKMAEASRLLDQGKSAEAQQTLDEVIAALEELVRLLVDQRSPELDKNQEMKMLEQWKEKIQQLQREQKQQTRETDNVANQDDAAERLEAQIKAVKELIEKQRQVMKETEDKAGEGLRAMDKVADQQFDIRQQTEKLKNEIQNPDGDEQDNNGIPSPDSGDPQQTPPKENQPGAGGPPAKPGENPKQSEKTDPPGEKQTGEKQNAPPEQQNKDSDANEKSDSQNPPGKPGQPGQPGQDSPPGQPGQPGEQNQPGDQPPPAPPTPAPPRPGEQPLEKAAEHQQRAEEKLATGKAEDAQRQQEQALKELEAAQLELEKEKRRIASLPPEALKQLAEEQRRMREKAMEIAQEMKEAPKPKPADPNAEQPQQPGQQSMDQAGDSMQQAADKMEQEQGEEAKQEQKQAEEKMQTALDEIEERLNQLREETREEKLARLEARFREMLDRQKVASLMTTELNDKQIGLGALERRDELVLLRLSTEEAEISELGQQAYDLLLEDGTSVVFPEVVQILRDDLDRASALLAEKRTDQLTQLVQREIESSLEELIDALQKGKNKGSGGGGGGGGGGKQPLLEKSAELKILRVSQRRINRQTKQFDSIKAERNVDNQLEQAIQSIAQRQAELMEMTERIMQESDQ